MLGADGAATLGSLGRFTVRQPVKKLQIISDAIIIGTSGPVGLGQRFAAAMQDMWETRKLSGKKPHEAVSIMRQAFWAQAEPEFAVAKTTVQVLGQQALDSVLAHTIVALPLNKEPSLVQFDHQCAPELASGDLPFIAVGSGQPLADTFLAFLRRIFWSDKQPRINDGVLATIWSLDQAIRTNPGGVGYPIQIMTMRRESGTGCKINELTEADFEEHRQAIAVAEERLRTFRDSFAGPTNDASPIPTP